MTMRQANLWQRMINRLSVLCIVANLFPQPAHAQRPTPRTSDAAQAWPANQRVFGDLGLSVHSEPAIATNGGQVLVAWTDERNTQPDIYANLSNGNAITPANDRVTDPAENGAVFDNAPDVHVEANGRAFAVYSMQDDIVLARREVGQSAWLSHTLASLDNDIWYADARRPAMGVNGTMATIIWQDYRNENWDIYSTRCDLDAMTCQPNIKVSDAVDASWQIKPRIAMYGPNVMAVWEDYREGEDMPHVYASYSPDGGATWGGNGRIDTASPNDPATTPSVGYASDGTPWIVWEQHSLGDMNSSADIFAAKWDGAQWASQPRVDNAPGSKRALNPRIAGGYAGGGADVIVVWEDYRTSGIRPRIYSGIFNGTGWDEGEVNSTESGGQTRPAIAISGSDVRVSWQDTRDGHPDIYAARWGGTAWADIGQVNEDDNRMAKQYHPNLVAVGNGDVYMSWLDTRDYEIRPYISRYLFTGNRWGEPIAVPVVGAGRYDVLQEQVASALDSAGMLHVMWVQTNDAGEQIFHSRYNGTNGTWSGVIQASDTTTSTLYRPRRQPMLAIRGNKIAATWIEWDASVTWPLPTKIYAAIFDGEKWIQSIVSQGVIRGDPHPSITVDDGGNVYVAWSDMRWDGQGIKADIMVAKQGAAGGAWSTPVRVNSTPSTLNYCINERPYLKAAGNTLHITWTGCIPWTDNVFYSSSSNGGATWASSQALSMVGDNPTQPVLTVGAGEVTLVYGSKISNGANIGEFRFLSAKLQGSIWVTDTVLSDGATAWVRDDDGPPSIAYDPVSNGYMAAWVDHRMRGLPQLFFSKTGTVFEAKAWLYLPLVRK